MTPNLHDIGTLPAPAPSKTSAAGAPLPPPQPPAPLGRRLLDSVPTVAVLMLLGALAWYGHHTGWTVPKFSELTGNGAAAADDWCAEHSVPESICVECNESLLPRGKAAWCRTHGVHYCPFERPEIVQLESPPTIAPADLEVARRALALKDRPASSSKCTMHERRIQLASEEVMNKMGIDVVPPVWRGPILETITASGEIAYEQTRVAPISTPVAGRVWHVADEGQIGAQVKRGDLLAIVDAAEVGKVKTELLQAVAQHELKQKVVENQKAAGELLFPAPRRLEAESHLREAYIRVLAAQQALVNLGLPVQLEDIKGASAEDLARRLHFFGIPQAVAARLDPRTTSANLYPVLASRDGVITAAKVGPGAFVNPSDPLFVVTDVSRMWLILNVRNEDAKYLRIRDAKSGAAGQTVRFRADGGDSDIAGELVWKSTAVDAKTRTLQVRAEVPNPDGTLLAHTFGVGQIVLREEKNAVLVASEAVHWEGDCHIVFVRDKNFLKEGAPKVFHIRTVRPGVKQGDTTEIIAGLWPGEVVAVKNSASLRSELLKNNLGAG